MRNLSFPLQMKIIIEEKKYTNIDELNRDRTKDILDVTQGDIFLNQTDILNNMKIRDEDINIRRAYKLMNQDEEIRENYNIFWSDLKRLKNEK